MRRTRLLCAIGVSLWSAVVIGNQSAPCSSGPGLSMKGERCRQLRGDLHLCAEAGAKALADCFVVGGLGEQFGPSLSREARPLHGAMLRASAKTSSAANVSTSPRS